MEPLLHAYSPSTVRHRVAFPVNALVYTTTLKVPRDWLWSELDESGHSDIFPDIGEPMGKWLGERFDDNLLTDVSQSPGLPDDTIVLTHAKVPTNLDDWESAAYSFPAIYPNKSTFFPNGTLQRDRVVLARVHYEFTARESQLQTWRAAEPSSTSGKTAPIHIESGLYRAANEQYVDSNGKWRTIGSWLNSVFITQNTLHDFLEINDPGDLHFTIPSSAPTASTWALWVQTRQEVMISRVISRWQGPIFFRASKYVVAQ